MEMNDLVMGSNCAENIYVKIFSKYTPRICYLWKNWTKGFVSSVMINGLDMCIFMKEKMFIAFTYEENKNGNDISTKVTIYRNN